MLNIRELPRTKTYSHHVISPLSISPFPNFSLVRVEYKGSIAVNGRRRIHDTQSATTGMPIGSFGFSLSSRLSDQNLSTMENEPS